jgi:hypothetical protein
LCCFPRKTQRDKHRLPSLATAHSGRHRNFRAIVCAWVQHHMGYYQIACLDNSPPLLFLCWGSGGQRSWESYRSRFQLRGNFTFGEVGTTRAALSSGDPLRSAEVSHPQLHSDCQCQRVHLTDCVRFWFQRQVFARAQCIGDVEIATELAATLHEVCGPDLKQPACTKCNDSPNSS